MTSGKVLFVGTMGNEWVVSGGNNSAVTPENLMAQRHTTRGSMPIKPVDVNYVTLFVGTHGREVFEFAYNYQYDSFVSINLLELSSHLTDVSSIKAWAYQQSPHSLIWCLKDDGSLITATYERDQKVVAWTRHYTDGDVLTLCSIPGDNREDELWIAVKRMVGKEHHLFIEKLSSFDTPDKASAGRYVDSYAVYDGDPTDVISGLHHLNLRYVSVMADGMVLPDRLVANGRITLPAEYSHVVIGLPYVSEVWPNIKEMSLQSGVTYGRVQRITSVVFDFYKTLGLYVGRYDSEDGEQVEEIAFRRPFQPTNEETPLYSGFYKWSFHEGFDRGASYFLRQTQPLPFTLRAVTLDLEVTET